MGYQYHHKLWAEFDKHEWERKRVEMEAREQAIVIICPGCKTRCNVTLLYDRTLVRCPNCDYEE